MRELGPGTDPIAEALSEVAAEDGGRVASRAAPWAVMTGPEGGLAESELDALRNLPFVTPVGPGPRVLRSDTAALAATSLKARGHTRNLDYPSSRFRAAHVRFAEIPG